MRRDQELPALRPMTNGRLPWAVLGRDDRAPAFRELRPFAGLLAGWARHPGSEAIIVRPGLLGMLLADPAAIAETLLRWLGEVSGPDARVDHGQA
jgi:hypothetical protein